jgi:FixJ family two-component response regulator
MTSGPHIYLVDDDPRMLRALGWLLRAEGFDVRPYDSARRFLEEYEPDVPGCLVLDVAMPEIDGLELQRLLAKGPSTIPIIFLSGHGDIPMAVRAIQAGAVNFFTKPVMAEDLLNAIRQALGLSATRSADVDSLSVLKARLDTLSPRELEVMQHVITGKLNKQTATDLGVAEHTIKIHRMRLMRKLEIQSVVDLIWAAERLGVAAAH